MTTIHFQSPTLESTTRREGSKFWRIKAYTDDEGTWIQSEAWQPTHKDHQFSTPRRVEPKNVGRSNETTPEQQAVSQAQSDMRKKLDSGYWIQGQGPREDALPLPMLAMQGTWDENKHFIQYPAAVQPKFDGHRMLFDGHKGWTRKGKLVIAECIQHLAFDTQGIILDGELMLPHDKYGFEAGTSAAKKFDPNLSPELVFMVYDYIDESATFRERWARLEKMAKSFPPNVILAETRTVNNDAEVLQAHGQFTEAGHEGAITRNLSGLYRLQHRSHDLVKVKLMVDAEFIIVDVHEGTGKFAGMAGTFEITTLDGKPVGKATPKGSFAQKRAYLAQRQHLIGKVVTVQYQGIGSDGGLRFPVALRLRDDL